MSEHGSSHTFSEIFLHVNWHCLKDQRMIHSEVEAALYPFIEEYCAKVKGIHLKGIGGTETHVHLAFQFEPFVLLSDFIGKVKGASSYAMNKRFGAGTLDWQRGYGIVSFSKRQLSFILDYVANQKEHHAAGSVNEILERHREREEG